MSAAVLTFAEFEQALREGTAFAEESVPELREGASVAWSYKAYGGVTKGLSSVHRVASLGENPVAFCGAAIPSARLRVPVLRSLPICGACANAYAKTRLAIVA